MLCGLDRTYFAAGETIWLKAYVEDELPDAYASLFLYVELLEQGKKEAVLRAKIRRGEAGFAGHLDLPEELPGGHYLLRAYTRWQLNWPEESLFRVPIDVYDGTDFMRTKSITPLRRTALTSIHRSSMSNCTNGM